MTSQNRKSALPETGSPYFPKANANKTDKIKLNGMILTYPSPHPPPGQSHQGTAAAVRMDEMDSYRELIKENISYDLLLQENPYDDD